MAPIHITEAYSGGLFRKLEKPVNYRTTRYVLQVARPLSARSAGAAELRGRNDMENAEVT